MAKDFKTILAEAMAQIPDTMDKRQSSNAYIHLAPFSYELSCAYSDMDSLQDNICIDTATGEVLTKLCGQYGVFRKNATKAQRKGIFNVDVSIGARFGIEKTTYKVLSKLESLVYCLECEQLGEIGNIYTDTLLPIDYTEGLKSSKITDILIPGVEQEDDESLRERYRQSIINSVQNGNMAQYKRWALDFEGVGTAKVFPVWNGGNTVKIAITDRLYLPAGDSLVGLFQEYIDPNSEGLGNGAAPIGAKVTVTGGTKKDIFVSAKIRLTEGYTEPEGLNEDVAAYLASLTYSKITVSYLKLGGVMLNNISIADMTELLLNNGNTDIALSDEEIPVLGGINLVVIQ